MGRAEHGQRDLEVRTNATPKRTGLGCSSEPPSRPTGAQARLRGPRLTRPRARAHDPELEPAARTHHSPTSAPVAASSHPASPLSRPPAAHAIHSAASAHPSAAMARSFVPRTPFGWASAAVGREPSDGGRKMDGVQQRQRCAPTKSGNGRVALRSKTVGGGRSCARAVQSRVRSGVKADSRVGSSSLLLVSVRLEK